MQHAYLEKRLGPCDLAVAQLPRHAQLIVLLIRRSAVQRGAVTVSSMWESAPRRVGISLTGGRRPAPVTEVHNRAVTFLAPDASGLARVCVAARQRDPSALTQLALPQFARRHCQLRSSVPPGDLTVRFSPHT